MAFGQDAVAPIKVLSDFAKDHPSLLLKVGIIDVPGHEKFVKNMLAGIGGIDLVLLVIALDEGGKAVDAFLLLHEEAAPIAHELVKEAEQ